MLAYILNISGWLLLPFMDGIAKYLSVEIHFIQVIWGRYFFMLLVSFPFAFIFFRKEINFPKTISVQLFRSFFLFLSTVFFFYAISIISLAEALTLAFISPIFAALFSVFILKENPSIFTWIVILIAMFAMIIIGIGSFTTSGLYGDLMALIVAIGMGFSMVLVRLFKNQDFVPACLIGCLISALYVLPFGINFKLSTDQIYLLLLMCFIILPIPFIILTISPKFTPAHEVALIFLLESVLGTAWVWFVINEIPPINTIIGGTILLGSVAMFTYQTTKKTN